MEILTSAKKFKIEDGVLKKYNGNAKSVVIPDSVTDIETHSFRHHKKIIRI